MADEAVRRKEEGFTAAAGGVLSQIGGSLYAVGAHTISYSHTHKYIRCQIQYQTQIHAHTKKNKEVQLLVFIIIPYLIFLADTTDYVCGEYSFMWRNSRLNPNNVNFSGKKLFFLVDNCICWWTNCMFCVEKNQANNFACEDQMANIMYVHFPFSDLPSQCKSIFCKSRLYSSIDHV